MYSFIQNLIHSAGTFFGLADMFFTLVDNIIVFLAAGSTVRITLAASGNTYYDIPEEILATARAWHGTIEAKFSNIENLVVTIQAHSSWGVPTSVFAQVVNNRTQLASLIPKCKSTHGAPADREQRNILLKSTVSMCLGQIKAWAHTQYYNNVMTLGDLHSLGFLLPGESGGKHDRAEPTEVIPAVKVKIISADVIRVVIDQSAADNAALVVHGWPPGVRMALIVITAADGVTEVIRKQTTRLHNNILMPAGSHGKQFLIKASFLRHIDDEPRFGPEPTFSMPLTTADLVVSVRTGHDKDGEANNAQ
jgi:hypothetical protein